MDHDTNTCTLRQWPASARGVIQVRPGTIIGGGGGEVAIRFRPITKSGGPLIVWHRAYSTLLLLPVTIMAEDPEHPLWDTLASAIYGTVSSKITLLEF